MLLRPYLEGIQFTTWADHDALHWILILTDVSGRLVCWRLPLSKFEFDVVLWANIKNQVAEAFLRLQTTDQIQPKKPKH